MLLNIINLTWLELLYLTLILKSNQAGKKCIYKYCFILTLFLKFTNYFLSKICKFIWT